MRKELKFIFLLFLLSILSVNVYGARRFWIGAVSNSWKNTANWSATSGGAGGASIPGVNDTAAFNGLSTIKRCNLDSVVNVKRLSISADTLSQGSYAITLGSSGANLTGGCFLGGSASITCSGAITLAGTSFTSTSGTFSISANFTFSSGSFTHNNGKVRFTATSTITVTAGSGSITCYQFELAPAASSTYTIASGTTLIVNNTFTISGSSPAIINTGAIHAKGNIVITSTSTTGTGTATLTINGSGTQTITGTSSVGEGKLPNVVINKSADTLKLTNIISVYGNWTWTAGVINAGTSTVHFANTLTITGSHALGNVNFSGGATRTFTIASGTTLTINGTLTTTGANGVTINTGTIHAKGDITCNNTSSIAGGDATIVINGSTDQIFTGSGTAGLGHFPKITIDKGPTDGTLTLASVINSDGDWTYTKGDVNAGTSTVVLYGTGNLDGQELGSSAMMSFYSLAIATGTRTLTGNLDVNNNLSIGNGSTLSAGSNSIYCGGNWTNTGGTWTYGTSTVIFDGSSYKQIKRTSGGAVVTETFYNLGFNRPSGSHTLKSPVTVNNVLTLTKGHVKTDTVNYLMLIDGATVSGGSDSAYVHGPVRKTGDDAFVFPLGDTTLNDTAYHPLAITAPAVNTDQFQATYFAANYPVGDSLVDSLESVSQVEYWKLERLSGSSNVYGTISWNRNSDNVEDVNALRVANWNGVKWLDLGNNGITISESTGTLSALIAFTYTSAIAYVTIGKKKTDNMYATLHRQLDGGYYLVTNGAFYFKYDEEYNDVDDLLTFNIYDERHRVAASSTGSYAILKPSDFGDNRFYINLLSCSTTSTGYLPAGYYILEVINEKNEKWYLRFKHNLTVTPYCNSSPLPD